MRADYNELVRRRKKCQLCSGLANPSVVLGGELDSDEIGPYSRWQGALDAELIVVAKDFAPVQKFIEFDGKPGPKVQTNLRLSKYLEAAGYSVGTPDEPEKSSKVFFTNAVLCLAGGSSMRTAIPDIAVKTCGKNFLQPLIQLIQPKFLVALGSHATQAVLESFGISGHHEYRDLLESRSALALGEKLHFFAMPHPMASVTKEAHERAWRRLRCT